MCLRIDRLWGQRPGWFMTLERSLQVQLLAEHRLLNETPEQAKKNAQRAKRADLERRLGQINV